MNIKFLVEKSTKASGVPLKVQDDSAITKLAQMIKLAKRS